MNTSKIKQISFFIVLCVFNISFASAQEIALKNITIVQDKKEMTFQEAAATALLTDEIFNRIGIKIKNSEKLPSSGDVILLRKKSTANSLGIKTPSIPSLQNLPESYRITNFKESNRTVILIEGFDDRGLLFGIGKLLRQLKYKTGAISLSKALSISSTPDKSIRGHQLGYRNTANSYDGWTKKQFEQYIKDLIVFGTNSIESIPIFDEKQSPHFKVDPMEMNAYISSLCKKYGLDYWMWIPAQFDLSDQVLRKIYLDQFEKICQQSATITGVFFPGGDPGDNPPEKVLPLLKDLYTILIKYHPQGNTWLSLQGFTPVQCQVTYKYIQENNPVWLGGLITGPSSPTAAETRPVLPIQYKLRHYPDLTHNVRCEFEIPWWDPAFNLTLGREAVNPRPFHYGAIYNSIESYIDGFLSYSDGVHDDVNKIIWTVKSWDKNTGEREILKEYSNYFFGSTVSETAADGIIALENNWQGPIVANGAIHSTLETWKMLEAKNPALQSNWRWQMNLLRAYYDEYTRKRFIYESTLENETVSVLNSAEKIGSSKAIDSALSILSQAKQYPVLPQVHKRIIDLCEALYQSINLQTSVPKYQASGSERGAVLDFLDRPLNNTWWYEDEFKNLEGKSEIEKITRLKLIANWENPSPGSFYDEVGNIGKSIHEMKGEDWRIDPTLKKNLNPGYDFASNGFSRRRLSWLTNMRWPTKMEYTQIDSSSEYTIRINGQGDSFINVNGHKVSPSVYSKKIGEFKEYPIPKDLYKTGTITITWDNINEDNMNWREQSNVNEVWLIKK